MFLYHFNTTKIVYFYNIQAFFYLFIIYFYNIFVIYIFSMTYR